MKDPEVNHQYHFVRRRDDIIDHAKFTRFEDGSAIVYEGGYVGRFELDANVWREALEHLLQLGYKEVSEAVQAGILTAEEANRLITNSN